MITKVVNALTAATETGGPMCCAYLLGFPDHYTNRKFKVFFWHTYVRTVERAFGGEVQPDSMGDSDLPQDDNVVIAKAAETVVGLNKVDDYIFRPLELSEWSLYDFLRRTHVQKSRKVGPTAHHLVIDDEDNVPIDNVAYDGSQRSDRGGLAFLPEHPLHSSRLVYVLDRPDWFVLDFLGGHLPRRDKGDREAYCRTMLVLFRPGGWRRGQDLKSPEDTWEAALDKTVFADEHNAVMANMNMLYECKDTRDDFAAQRRLDSQINIDLPGEKTIQSKREMQGMHQLLASVLTAPVCRSTDIPHPADPPRVAQHPRHWKEVLDAARQAVLQFRKDGAVVALDNTGTNNTPLSPRRIVVHSDGTVTVVSAADIDAESAASLQCSRKLQDPNVIMVHNVAADFQLNADQLRAFTLAAERIQHRDRDPLRMYLGGMGGTGKSRVLHALTALMCRRLEQYRFAVLAPTGSAACLVDGTTYHSALGFSQHTDKGTTSAHEGFWCARCELWWSQHHSRRRLRTTATACAWKWITVQ
ncbi:hypothetical protein B0H21DRAFT_781660 [Amylocystis lapponica]|nr:hypothetical protein B0H21DRAFT_781660 [Amylocystis lapponica]